MTDHSDKPCVKIEYRGMQIRETREHIQVVLDPNPPRGVKACLRLEGFKLEESGIWTRRNNPMAIMTAQAIGKTFFEESGT